MLFRYNAFEGDNMKHDNKESIEIGSLIADIAPMLDALHDQIGTLSQLFSACNDKVVDDSDLQARMELIDELYSHADSEDHVAARFAESVADRVYEYETETILVPHLSQSEALSYLIESRGIKQKDLSEIATQSVISEILHSKRKMTVSHIKGFSDFFKVPVEFFMHGPV